jgi:V8-like Glu-specific endopeptidase
MNVRGQGADRGLARSAWLLAIVSASTLALWLGASPAAMAAVPGATTAPVSAQDAARFWTPARMRQAEPLDVHPGERFQAPVASPGDADGIAPRRIGPLASEIGASASSEFDQVADPTTPAFRQSGAIFFEVEGSLARCSGTSVNAGNFSVVFTAGHCVNSGGPGGRWYRGHWVFVPGYRYGQRPFGVFPAKWLDTTFQWRASGSENFDVGAAVVGRNAKGQRLGKAVGGTGIAWGLPAKQVFDVHGYPAAPPFNGETQRLCPQTPFLGHDPSSFLFGGPLNLAVDCDVTGGASGGGWTIRRNVLNSVTNYGYPDDRATDFGAYFGKEVARLYGRAARVK